MTIQITIPITPVTKKNHQQIMRSSKTGKPFVMPSAEYRQYEAQAVWHCKRAAISAGVHKPIDTPCEVRGLPDCNYAGANLEKYMTCGDI